MHIDEQLKVVSYGAAKELRHFSNSAKNLGELLISLDKWLEDRGLSASGIIGSECNCLLNKKLHWVADLSSISEQIRGECLVFVVQAGHIEDFPVDKVTRRGVSNKNDKEMGLQSVREAACTASVSSGNRRVAEPFQGAVQPIEYQTNGSVCNYGVKNEFLIDKQTVAEVDNVVRRGLEIRERLDIEHLVVSVKFPVYVDNHLLNSWFYTFKTPVNQRFLMKSENWNLISCTPERFISISDSKLQVQILAGTFQSGTSFDEVSLIHEHQAARNTLRTIVEKVVGKLELTVDCNLMAFDKITHFHSAFEKPYQSNNSMLLTLAHLTPSPATGTQDRYTQVAIQKLEGRTRGYYGGCFFLRTPGCLESLVSIRSIFKMSNSEIGEMLVGAGLKKGSILSSESSEIISKATTSAKLLGVKLGI
jgi:hypothetical protein